MPEIETSILDQQILSPTLGTYIPSGLAAANGSDATQKLDPYGLLSAPQSPLGDYDFANLPAGKTASFLDAVSMTKVGDFPDVNQLQAPLLPAADRQTNGVSHAHHSIWVGGPLVETDDKKKPSWTR